MRRQVGDKLRGSPRFLLAGDPAQNVPFRSPLLYVHFSKSTCYTVSIAEKVFSTLRTFPKVPQIPFRYCSIGLQEPAGIFPNTSWHIIGRFLYSSLEAACFSLLRFEIKDAASKLNNHQWFLY